MKFYLRETDCSQPENDGVSSRFQRVESHLDPKYLPIFFFVMMEFLRCWKAFLWKIVS
jgi:hypothetical protein